MQATGFIDGTCERKLDGTPDFHVAIIYDTPQNAARALKVCHRLIDRFNRDFLFYIALCDVRSFGAPLAATSAMKGAARARIVFIAANRSLPDSVCRWLEEWAEQAEERPLAVACMSAPDSFMQSGGCPLDQLCRRHEIDLIDQDQNAVNSFARRAAGEATHQS